MKCLRGGREEREGREEGGGRREERREEGVEEEGKEDTVLNSHFIAECNPEENYL